MNTQLELISEAVEIVDNSNQTTRSRGCYASFFRSQTNSQWGYKVYSGKFERDQAFFWQREFNKHGLAPNVGRRFATKCAYGFTTEIAKLIEPIPSGLSMSKILATVSYWERKLRAMGVDFIDSDGHRYNLAIYKGQLVSIDCNLAYAHEETPSSVLLQQRYRKFMRDNGHERF